MCIHHKVHDVHPALQSDHLKTQAKERNIERQKKLIIQVTKEAKQRVELKIEMKRFHISQPSVFKIPRLSRRLMHRFFRVCFTPHRQTRALARLMGKLIPNLAFVLQNDPPQLDSNG